MKRYGLKEEESMHVSLEKRGIHACEGDRGRRNINIITEKKLQHSTCHKARKQQRPQHAAVSNAASKTSFSALISSPFIFSLALVSPFNFDPSPISSRQFPVRNIRKDEKR